MWAPSTGYVIPDRRQPLYGLKQVGYVEHRLEPDGRHESRLVQVPGMATRYRYRRIPTSSRAMTATNLSQVA